MSLAKSAKTSLLYYFGWWEVSSYAGPRISRLDSFLCVYVCIYVHFFQLSVLPVISLVDGSVQLLGLSVSEFSIYIPQLPSPFLVGMMILQ